MNKNIPSSRLKFFFKAVLTVGILYVLFRTIPFNQVTSAVSNVSIWYLLAAIAITFICQMLSALQMYFLTRIQGIALSLWEIFLINQISSFYGLVLPNVVASSAIRWHRFAVGGKAAQAVAGIVFNRLLETLSVIAVGFFFWIQDKRSHESFDHAANLFLPFVALLAVYVLSFNPVVHGWLHLAFDHPRIPRFFSTKIKKLLKAFALLDQMSFFFHAKVFVVCIVKQAGMIYSLYLLAQGMNLSIGYIELGWIRSVVALVLLLPVSVSGFGVREATFVFLLKPYGVSAEDGMALSLLFFFRGLVFSILGGIIEAKEQWFSRKTKSVSQQEKL